MMLASKIQPPPLPAACIPRPKLHARLDQCFGYRLTTVVAGPGFGKTTLLASWSATASCAWYAIDASDASSAVLARGLVEALRRAGLDLPGDLVRAGPGSGRASPDEDGQVEALAAYLSESLRELLTDELVLVLDDAQELGRRGPSVRLIEALCRHAPGRLHIVLASREEPPFAIERLRRANQLLEVESVSLAFSRQEVASLLEGALGPRAAGLAASIQDATGGWPAAVRLTVEALHALGAQGAATVLDGLPRPGGTLFTYLAQKVLAREPPSVRSFLRRVAPFERVTLELCEALGVTGASKALASLLRRGLFIQPQGDPGGWFRLHALIREFVLLNWPLPARDQRALHQRAGAWFKQQGQPEESLRCLAAAPDPQGLASLLESNGPELLAGGAAELVVTSAGLIPAELRSPALEEIVGEAHVIRAESKEALECFRRAAGQEHQLSPGLAWRMGRIHLDGGRLAESLAVYGRARLDGAHPRDEARLLACVASAHLLSGDLASSRVASRRALDLALSTQDPHALAAAHSALMAEAIGTDPEAADAHYHSALEWAERGRDVLMSLRVRGVRTAQLNEEGSYEHALHEVEAALRLAELAGYTEFLAVAQINRGLAHFHVGHLEHAIADFDAAKAICLKSGSSYISWSFLGRGMVCRERGDLTQARALLEQARDLAERSRDVQGLIQAQANLACLLAIEEPKAARHLAEEALEDARSWGFGFTGPLVVTGWVALTRGDRESAARLAAEAASKARERRNHASLAEALELAALSAPDPASETGLLDQAIGIWREIGSQLAEARAELALARLSDDAASPSRAAAARRRLEALGVRPHAAAGAAGILHSLPPDAPQPLAIRTLGGFQVFREGRPVPLAEWRSKQARDLLKILIARRGRPITRQALMDLLWPGHEPEVLPKRLFGLLAALRAVLDRPRRFSSDHFIAGDEDGLRLQTAHLGLDVESFLAQASLGLALEREGRSTEAGDVLAGAEASYTGDFLEENLYNEWAESLREEARARYVAVARRLAQAAADLGESDAAGRYLLRILEREPHDEEAHLALVRLLAAAGRYGEARRAYRTYVRRMEDLTVEPAPFPTPAGT